ncbi:MAG TPA: cytochrome c [Povalibacter sp.]|nr:cytochrome c [Povalibacter sp.]
MSNRFRSKTALLLISGLAVAAPLSMLVAQDDHAHGEGIYKVRHDGYHKLGDAFKTLRDETGGRSPNVAAIKEAAQVVSDTSVHQYDWFPAGSGPKAGVKTRAKAEIWSKPEDFAAAQKLFADQAKKLHAAANSGDVAAVKAQFGETGKACKNCHDNFRAPEDKK